MAEPAEVIAEPVAVAEKLEPTVSAPGDAPNASAVEAIGGGDAVLQEAEVNAKAVLEEKKEEVEPEVTPAIDTVATESDKAAAAAAAATSPKKKSRWRRVFETLRAKLRRVKKTVGPTETPPAPSVEPSASEPIKDEAAEKKEAHADQPEPEEKEVTTTTEAKEEAPEAAATASATPEQHAEAKETTAAATETPTPPEGEKKE